ncbi:MAG TPA: hypothetical protein PKZ84_07605 [Anaerolineae bacterium]|nr:hypothetical protein [Anaerolineae bacterium]HQI84132.1 hypothetical protein [Anaerolineae bacterium]
MSNAMLHKGKNVVLGQPWRIASMLTFGKLRETLSRKVITDVVGGHAVQHGFDAVAVPSLHSGQATVVGEAGVGHAAHGHQVVFSVVGEPMRPCLGSVKI